MKKRWIAGGIAVPVFLGLLAGCTPTMRIGSPPKISGLKILRPGISTVSQVREALGEPRGYGALLHSADPTPWIRNYTEASSDERIGLKAPADPTYRKIWFYEYIESSGNKMGLKFLLVFFLDDRYDGHLWFSAAHLLDTKQ